ncbi:DNA cytosine methyltransferase [Ruminococcus flavefaciens]|uniref:DNA cytosine methyltransferase n=1 Tax=Ruminococcus flavefaciens TaxID=1265 RepID=UPI0025D50087|nr:DNA cytosine methyltransferase [Ruminococcus flavefaciens]
MIRYLDMFAGIGGFRSGLDKVGGFECVAFCEIDKYAKMSYEAMYDTEGEVYYNDARKIIPEQLPDIDLIVGGFPCQPYSREGARNGFNDSRGTLFFEISRIAAVKKPKYLLLENVPGLLDHDGGRTFKTILNTLEELGYDVAWSVLDGTDFGSAQQRKRVFIIGYYREKCRGRALPVPTVPSKPDSEDSFMTVWHNGRKEKIQGDISELLKEFGVPIKVKTKSGYMIALPGDSIDLAYPNLNSRRGRVGRNVAHTVTPSVNQGYYLMTSDDVPEGAENIKIVEIGGVSYKGYIRRFTPLECWRLQGFTDEQFYKAKAAGVSNRQLYKQAGNAVTVNVIEALARFIKEIDMEEYENE